MGLDFHFENTVLLERKKAIFILPDSKILAEVQNWDEGIENTINMHHCLFCSAKTKQTNICQIVIP